MNDASAAEMTGSSSSPACVPGLLELFDRTYVINLPERTDRRREMEEELHRPLLASDVERARGRVHFFEASWPAEAAPFRSRGTKGNFLSHLSILRVAQAQNLESVLIFEDDAEFEEHLGDAMPWLRRDLARLEWGVVQLGYMSEAAVRPPGTPPSLVPFRGEVLGAHCYAVHRRAIAPLIAHLERQLAGAPGDDLYGPMSYDGSLNTFAWVHPNVERHLAVPSLCRQRSSSSSVNPRVWDRISGARVIADTVRRVRRSVHWVHRHHT